MSQGDEVLSVRFILDANPAEVCNAVSKALLFGQPPKQREAGGWPMIRVGGGMLLPWPMSAEWQEATANVPCMMNPESVFNNSIHFNTRSFSMGLRPLGKTDSIAANMKRNGYRVKLEVGFPSTFTTTDITPLPGTGRKPDSQSFHIMVSSAVISAATANTYLESVPAMSNLDEVLHNSWIAFKLHVRPLGRRTEVVREILERNPLTDVATFCENKRQGYLNEHMAVNCLRTISFNMEMEMRAWTECAGFSLLEVWRGARCTQDWAASGNNLTVASYLFCVGHAGYSALEKKEGPLFDMKLAQRLSEVLPKELVKGGAQNTTAQQFIEGNVQVESFAGILDRVCRRAVQEDDIYRRFVDLGSGPGFAVLTAHLLFPFRDCVGVELQPRVAKSARLIARQHARSSLVSQARCKVPVKDIFLEGDLLKDLDWSDASVIFANAVTWPKDMIRQVATQALRLRRGSVLLLAARQLPCEMTFLEAFEVRGEACLMSFSSEAIFIWAYQRR